MIKNNIKIAWRNLKKRRISAFINITGLALSFACGLLLFLFVSHHLKFEDFHKNSDRIYRVVTESHNNDVEYEASVPPGFANAFRTDYNYAEKVAKTVRWTNRLLAINQVDGIVKLKEEVAFAEPDFFEILNFPLIQCKSRNMLSNPNTAVITQSMAKKIFGDESPINKTFQLEGKETITIIGVLKDLPANTLITSQIFISFKTLSAYNSFLSGEQWGGISSNLQCFTLLHKNQDISQIEEAIAGYVQLHRPNSKTVHHYKMQALSDIHFNRNYSGGMNTNILWILSLIGFFLIAVACINFINISTAQSFQRSKEIGVRKVLGSLKNQLFWQFIMETFIVNAFALLLGILISVLYLPYLNNVFALNLSFYDVLNFKNVGIIFSLLLLVSFLSGSYPGLILSRLSTILTLKKRLSQKDTGGLRTRKVLVTSQFAISMVLIIGTIAIGKQLKYATNSDLGYDESAVIMVKLPSTLEQSQLTGLKNRIAQYSGIENVTACFASPGAGKSDWSTNVAFNNNPEDESFLIDAKMGDENYVNTFDLQLVAGRNYGAKDALDEVLVNETFGKKLGLTPEQLLRKQLSLNGGFIKASIVGVVADFHDKDFHEEISPIFITPLRESYNELAIKTSTNNAKTTIANIEKEWNSVFPGYIFEFDFLDDLIKEQYEAEQRFLTLTKLLSFLTIFISCLGIYGLISFYVTQKTKEIGIRKVNGAKVSEILSMLNKDFIKWVSIAFVVACPIAYFAMNKWLENFAYKTTLSWWIFALAGALALGIALLTVSWQSWRAATRNPVEALRYE